MIRSVQLRALARDDLESAVRYPADRVGPDTALDFVAAFETSASTLASQPGIGSPRFATELHLPGLRAWGLAGFPYLIFYRFDDDRVDVWRVLHSRRDLPGAFHGSTNE